MKRTFSFHYTTPQGLTAIITYSSEQMEGFSGRPFTDNKVESIAVPYAGHIIEVGSLFDAMDEYDLPNKMYDAIVADAEKQWSQVTKRAAVKTAAQS